MKQDGNWNHPLKALQHLHPQSWTAHPKLRLPLIPFWRNFFYEWLGFPWVGYFTCLWIWGFVGRGVISPTGIQPHLRSIHFQPTGRAVQLPWVFYDSMSNPKFQRLEENRDYSNEFLGDKVWSRLESPGTAWFANYMFLHFWQLMCHFVTLVQFCLYRFSAIRTSRVAFRKRKRYPSALRLKQTKRYPPQILTWSQKRKGFQKKFPFPTLVGRKKSLQMEGHGTPLSGRGFFTPINGVTGPHLELVGRSTLLQDLLKGPPVSGPTSGGEKISHLGCQKPLHSLNSVSTESVSKTHGPIPVL